MTYFMFFKIGSLIATRQKTPYPLCEKSATFALAFSSAALIISDIDVLIKILLTIEKPTVFLINKH